METMEEKFEKWAEEIAIRWSDGFYRAMIEQYKVLDDKGLKYIILKALRAGHAYGNNAEKQS